MKRRRDETVVCFPFVRLEEEQQQQQEEGEEGEGENVSTMKGNK